MLELTASSFENKTNTPTPLERFKNTYRELNADEIKILESNLGPRFKEYLDSLGASLFIRDDEVETERKQTQIYESWLQKLLVKFRSNYLMTQFATVVDERIIHIATWSKVEGADKQLPQHVAQIDFMFLDDWYSDKKTYALYKNVKKADSHSEYDGIQFLRKMKQLVSSIDRTCLIQLFPSNEQRKRIYKAALSRLENVVFADDE